jgi:hypothetical protein
LSQASKGPGRTPQSISASEKPLTLARPGAPQAARLALLEALEPFPLKLRPAEEQEAILGGLSAAELGAALDLRPFMQRTPFVLQARSAPRSTRPVVLRAPPPASSACTRGPRAGGWPDASALCGCWRRQLHAAKRRRCEALQQTLACLTG